MMDWRHGYYAETGYTYGHYVETMPVRLRWAALLQGLHAPGSNFRYLDAGCGQGYNLVLAALAHPDSEFVGIDFMPEHVAHGRGLAKLLGLENVTFIEGDFIALADDPGDLGEFDYVVCHGISTWISPTVRAALFRLIGRVLLPGGIFYNSYNTHPGWLPSVPFQHLVLLEQRSKPGTEAIKAAQEHIEAIRKGSAPFDKAYPGLEARMNDLKNRDPSYLVQEYNNQFWEPLFVSQMMDEMATVKLEYVGTATLSEAFRSHIPPSVRDRIYGETDPAIREQLADYTLNQGFRRDIYAKGRRRIWRAEHTEILREQRVMRNPFVARPPAGEPFKLKAASLEMKAPGDVYGAFLDRIEEQPDGCSIGTLIDGETDQRRRSTVYENISMLMHGNWLHLLHPEPPTVPTPTIRALVRAASDGAPYTFFPIPVTGTAIPMIETDWLAVGCLMDGISEAQLTEPVLAGLKRSNRLPLKDGQPVKDEPTMRKVLDDLIAEFREQRLPFLRHCKVL